jgi:hypothetical protein
MSEPREAVLFLRSCAKKADFTQSREVAKKKTAKPRNAFSSFRPASLFAASRLCVRLALKRARVHFRESGELQFFPGISGAGSYLSLRGEFDRRRLDRVNAPQIAIPKRVAAVISREARPEPPTVRVARYSGQP